MVRSFILKLVGHKQAVPSARGSTDSHLAVGVIIQLGSLNHLAPSFHAQAVINGVITDY